jgi:hypothetical protein
MLFSIKHRRPTREQEGDAVHYDFQVSSQAAEAGLIVGDSSATPNWVAPQALTDGAAYWWRYRVGDAAGATSAWSAWNTFTVSVRAQGRHLALGSGAAAGRRQRLAVLRAGNRSGVQRGDHGRHQLAGRQQAGQLSAGRDRSRSSGLLSRLSPRAASSAMLALRCCPQHAATCRTWTSFKRTFW